MRISDWSSDVCSSDLPSATGGFRPPPPAIQARDIAAAARSDGAIASEHLRRRLEFLAGRRSAEQVGLVRPARTAIADGEAAGAAFLEHVLGIIAVASGDQIGRASCRERGCQYV